MLITGENGTGKELVARALHALSRRAPHAFVEVNCAAIPEDLIESELFGHEKGAFTGASSRHRGKFDLAHEGTLFLDEIGDMSLKTQAKILRILEEQRFERVGGSRPIQVDVRVVAATNKNLEEEIAKGGFREDLYHRINVLPLTVPPLRERREDIPLLAAHFLQELSEGGDAPAKTFSPAALEALTALPWPGNVRELKNFVFRLAILSPGAVIDAGRPAPGRLGPGAGPGRGRSRPGGRRGRLPRPLPPGALLPGGPGPVRKAVPAPQTGRMPRQRQPPGRKNRPGTLEPLSEAEGVWAGAGEGRSMTERKKLKYLRQREDVRKTHPTAGAGGSPVELCEWTSPARRPLQRILVGRRRDACATFF